MEVVVKSDELMLIKKYNKYYIRFSAKTEASLFYDLSITNKEAISIVADNTKLSVVFDEYKNREVLDYKMLVDSTIQDYMFYVCNMSEKRIEKGLAKLNRHNDIKMEFYDTMMSESFPVNSPITVEGYTAKQLNETTHLTVMGAYNYLIYLREDPKTALDNLKKGLPTK